MTNRRVIPKAVRVRVAERTNWRCSYCGIALTSRTLVIDHIVAWYLTKDDAELNLTAACRSCNYYKSTFSIEQLRQQIMKWPARLERDSVTFKNALRFGRVTVETGPVVFYAEKIGLWKSASA